MRLSLASILISSILMSSCNSTLKNKEESNPPSFIGNWALVMPDGEAGWLTVQNEEGALKVELWRVGAPHRTRDASTEGSLLRFKRMCRIGKPKYPGGPPSGKRILVPHRASIKGDTIQIIMECPLENGSIEMRAFTGKRLPPLPPKPDFSDLTFGDPIALFNGKDLNGWTLTNPDQLNGWKALNGELVNSTPKKSFDPYSQYGNLRTLQEFDNFNLKLEFKVPPGGNSGVYLKGRYEAQVLDRDSKMQGIQGVGAIFGRIQPSINAGLPGDHWQSYDITLVDRYVTVILNGKKVIDQQPIVGMTKGALNADDTLPGPIYLQGDHTAVSYRNILLTPVVN